MNTTIVVTKAHQHLRKRMSQTLKIENDQWQEEKSYLLKEISFKSWNIWFRDIILLFSQTSLYTKFIQAIFSEMTHIHEIYVETKEKIQNNYKVWKNHTIDNVKMWVHKYIESEESDLKTVHNFWTLKYMFQKKYQPHWLKSVFKFADEAVNFNKCTVNEHAFLKCKILIQMSLTLINETNQVISLDAFIQLTVHACLTELHKCDCSKADLLKYDCDHLLHTYDALWRKKEWLKKKRITIADFSAAMQCSV